MTFLQIPGFCQGGATLPVLENQFNCDVIVGYKSVYRMCFAMSCFFFLFAALMIRVRNSKDPRAAIQNGWAVELLYLLYDVWENDWLHYGKVQHYSHNHVVL